MERECVGRECGGWGLGLGVTDGAGVGFCGELEQKMDEGIARYPSAHKRSAAMPLLHLWQEHFGFISDEAVMWIAEKLRLQPINILELVTFYPMFREHPPGKTHIPECPPPTWSIAGGFLLSE